MQSLVCGGGNVGERVACHINSLLLIYLFWGVDLVFVNEFNCRANVVVD